MKATVFYEDAPGVAVVSFGPHVLALACVADRMGIDRYALPAYAVGVPMKGDAKLRAILRGISGRHMIAVFDSDRVRDLYGLAHAATAAEVIAAIKAKEEAGPDVDVILLERNVEDLIRHCCVATKVDPPSRKPTPEERDRILHRAAAAAVNVREELLRLCPSFGLLVASLHRAVEVIRVAEALSAKS